MIGIHIPESELEVYCREFEKRAGYARAAPLVTVATLSRDESLIEWQARIDTGACISTFPEQIMGELGPLVLGPPLKIAGHSGVERCRTWRLPMVIEGDQGSWYDCPRGPGFVADSRDVGLIGMDVIQDLIQDLILVMMGGRFWLLHPERFTVNIVAAAYSPTARKRRR